MIYRKRRVLDGGMSFLDVISCGFGAVVMLVILAKNGEVPSEKTEEKEISSRVEFDPSRSELLSAKIARLRHEIVQISEKDASLSTRLKSLNNEIRIKRNEVMQQEAEATTNDSYGRDQNANVGSLESSYAGGIPVERQHVVFIIDTSGSMKRFWPVVEDKIESILSLHPQVKGIQIMSDNGDYLLGGYASKWIPDTEITRRRVIEKLRTWTTASISNPAKGLERALRSHAKESGGIAIYVMGDDFTGTSYDDVLSRVRLLNQPSGIIRVPAQIHGIAFPWGIGDRFSTLMRELALQNNGVFVTVYHPLQY